MTPERIVTGVEDCQLGLGAAAGAPMVDRAGLDMRMTLKKNRWSGQLLQRVDKVAADLNVLLLVFAVGLATLDFTFLVTQKVIDRLPQVTRLAQDIDNPTANPAPSPQK
jgi:hypothetical protein